MGSFKRPRVFHPLDLEIIDHVYEAAWAQISSQDPCRDASKDPERREALRKQIFAVAVTGAVDFDVLLDRVLSSFPETWVTFTKRRGSPEVGS